MVGGRARPMESAPAEPSAPEKATVMEAEPVSVVALRQAVQNLTERANDMPMLFQRAAFSRNQMDPFKVMAENQMLLMRGLAFILDEMLASNGFKRTIEVRVVMPGKVPGNGKDDS